MFTSAPTLKSEEVRSFEYELWIAHTTNQRLPAGQGTVYTALALTIPDDILQLTSSSSTLLLANPPASTSNRGFLHAIVIELTVFHIPMSSSVQHRIRWYLLNDDVLRMFRPRLVK